MENSAFYNQPSREFDEIDEPRGASASGSSGARSAGWKRGDQSHIHLKNGSNMCYGVWFEPAHIVDYDHMVDRSAGAGWKDERLQVDDARWRERPSQSATLTRPTGSARSLEQVDDARWRERPSPSATQLTGSARSLEQVDDARWRERPSAVGSARSRYDDYNKQSSKYRDYSDDHDRKYGQGAEEPPGRRSRRSKSRDRDRDHDTDRRDRNRCRDRERRNRRDESGYGNERDDSEYRPRRGSRSRDHDRSDRDRRHRDSDRDRRHRDVERGATRPHRDHDRDGGDRETSPKEIPWVPPPLPEHLRHLQVQWALTPVVGQQQGSSSLSSTAMQSSLAQAQNQFQNDGSFMEMFRQRMQQGAASAAPSAEVEDSSSSQGPSTLAASVVAAPVDVPKPPAVVGPSLAANSSGLPVIAKRRISKILKTGIVQKKKKEEEEEEDKGGDGWSSYMKEVQKYRANKCIENEASRPPLVK